VTVDTEMGASAPVSVWDLEWPKLDTEGLERIEALEVAAALAGESWLARTDMGFSALHYDDAVAILRDRRFHSALSQLPRMAGLPDTTTGYLGRRRQSILSMEGDEHTRVRRLVSPAFTPAAADRHRPTMRAVFEELLAPVRDAGGGEFVREVCDPYPIPIICEVLGAPRADWQRFSDWATNIFKIFNGNFAVDMPDIERASDELGAYTRAMIAERRDNRRDDLLSDLIAAEEDGDRLSVDEVVMLADAVLMAGTDTTRNQLGCALALFAQHPEQWARLRADRSLIPRAVEESLRYLGAVRSTVRFASEDIVYRDIVFPTGTFVTAHLASGNRDESMFADPGEFDVAAERSQQQLTFGSGIHRCLGAALARAELQEAFSVLVETVAEIALDGPLTWKPSSFGIWGPASLPLRLVPAR
jgi:cytochrome P450